MKPTNPHKKKDDIKAFNEGIEKEEYIHKGKILEKNNYANNKFLNKDEKPIRGGKLIDIEAMFGKDGEINFEGDIWRGGAV